MRKVNKGIVGREEEYSQFLDHQLDQFISIYCTSEAIVREELPVTFDPQQISLIQESTRRGIDLGLERFLESQGNPLVLFDSDLLREYTYHVKNQAEHPVVQAVRQEAQDLIDPTLSYALYVKQELGGFLYNDAFTAFCEQFS